MKDCKGIFGKLFGHKYKSYLSESIPPEDFFKMNIQGYTSTIDVILNRLTHRKYIVVCKRCGDKK